MYKVAFIGSYNKLIEISGGWIQAHEYKRIQCSDVWGHKNIYNKRKSYPFSYMDM